MDSNLILLTGARGAGKSTLVRRLLAENRRNGFTVADSVWAKIQALYGDKP